MTLQDDCAAIVAARKAKQRKASEKNAERAIKSYMDKARRQPGASVFTSAWLVDAFLAGVRWQKAREKKTRP